MAFSLHPQLAADCICLGATDLSQVLLLNDRQFPWLILVPMQEGISETYQLQHQDQLKLAAETNQIGQRMMQHSQGHKLNIGALGNMVPQLHVHLIVRFDKDAAWPKPVWGNYHAQPYSETELEGECIVWRKVLRDWLVS